MMSTQGLRSWDVDSVSSQTSDVTSRATTIYSPSEASIPIQKTIDRVNTQSNQVNQSSDSTTSSTATKNTVIRKKSDPEDTNRDQQQQWVNPYWGSNQKSNTSGTNDNTINTQSSSTHMQQLIPGSIMVNDQGEIDSLSGKRNQNDGSNSSLVSTHIQRHIVTTPSGLREQSENQSGIQRSSSSSNALNDSRPAFNRQQTFPQTIDKNIQPWVNPYWPNSQFKLTENQNSTGKSTTPNETWKNPYWKDWKSQNATTSQKQQDKPWVNLYWKDDCKPQASTTSNQQQSKPWVNPYWKDWKPQASTTSSQQQDKPWVNPYWKDWKPQASTTSSQQQSKPWVNPYWKDWKPQAPTTSGQQQAKPWVNPYWKDWKPQTHTTSSQQQNKPWVNPYWKDKNASDPKASDFVNNESLSFEYKVLPIPDFYKRIYPPDTPSSSPVPTIDLTNSNVISTFLLKQDATDDEEPPFTIDNQGIAHYRTIGSSTATTNKTNTVPPSSAPSQYPLLPPNPSSTIAPPAQISYSTSVPKASNDLFSTPTNIPLSDPLPSNTISSSMLNPANLLNYSSEVSSSGNVLTEGDLQSIQRALHSFEANSSSINVVEAPNEILSFDTSYPNNLSSYPFTHITGQQSYPKVSSPPTSTTYPANQSSSLSALITGNPVQQSNQQQSTITNPEKHSSPLAALFSANPVQPSNQQNPNTIYPKNRSSPLTALFSSNPIQPSNQPNPNTLYSENRSSPLSILFTRTQGQQSNPQYSIPSSNFVYSDDQLPPLSTFSTQNSTQQSNQPQLLSSSATAVPNTIHTSRPYSYDSNSQQLSVSCTSGNPSASNKPSTRWITQRPVVFI